MSTNNQAGLLTGNEESSARPTFLELFVDLVFVFALTRLSQRITDDLTISRRTLVSELGQTFLVTMALWTVWSFTVLMTSRFDPRRNVIQIVVVATMFGAMLMAISLPQAFGDLGLIFSSTYVALLVGRPLCLALAIPAGRAQSAARQILFWAVASGVPWLAGGLTGGVARGILWTAAVVLDFLGSVLRWPTPIIGRPSYSALTAGGQHLAERYQQLLLIALGEAILVSGFVFTRGGFAAGRTSAFVVAFLTTVLLWRIYFSRSGTPLAKAFSKARDPARFSQSMGHTHLVMLLGVVSTAVGYGLVIAHQSAPTDPAWVGIILGGPILFLVGRIRFEYALFGQVFGWYWIGLLALVVLIAPMLFLPLLAAPIGSTLVLAGIVIADLVREHRHPAEQARPSL